MWIGTKNEDTVGNASCHRRSMYSTPIMAPAGSLNTVGSYITCIIYASLYVHICRYCRIGYETLDACSCCSILALVRGIMFEKIYDWTRNSVLAAATYVSNVSISVCM